MAVFRGSFTVCCEQTAKSSGTWEMSTRWYSEPKMCFSTCKTQPVGVCSGSATVLTTFGLTGCNLDKFSRLAMGDDVNMWHYCLGQARLLGLWKLPKLKNRKISDFDEKPVFPETLAKFSRAPYPYGPKKCCFENFERQTIFFKKIRSWNADSSFEWRKRVKNTTFWSKNGWP